MISNLRPTKTRSNCNSYLCKSIGRSVSNSSGSTSIPFFSEATPNGRHSRSLRSNNNNILHFLHTYIFVWPIMHRVCRLEIKVHYLDITAFVCCSLFSPSLTSAMNQIQMAHAHLNSWLLQLTPKVSNFLL